MLTPRATCTENDSALEELKRTHTSLEDLMQRPAPYALKETHATPSLAGFLGLRPRDLREASVPTQLQAGRRPRGTSSPHLH